VVNAVIADTKLSKGYGKLGTKIGQAVGLYRAQNAQNPLNPFNLVQRLQVYFDINPQFTSLKPSTYNVAIWYAAFDRVGVKAQPFDYISDLTINNTWFVCDFEPIRPTMCIRCNDTVNIFRQTSELQLPTGQTSPYYGGYAPDITAGSQSNLIMQSIPISLLSGTKGEKGSADLPDDARLPYMKVKMPDLGIEILIDDILITATGHRYLVTLIERTLLGYQLSVSYQGT
jgi:hypothetical protein